MEKRTLTGAPTSASATYTMITGTADDDEIDNNDDVLENAYACSCVL